MKLHVLQVVACQVKLVLPVPNPTKQESKRKERKETKAQESSKLRYSLLCFCSIRFVEGEFVVVSYYGDGCTVLRVLYCTGRGRTLQFVLLLLVLVLYLHQIMQSKPVLATGMMIHQLYIHIHI